MSKTMAVLDNNNKVINIIIADQNIVEDSHTKTYTDENTAYIGGDYVAGYFYAPQPYASWTRQQGNWLPPKPYPTDNKFYSWDEKIGDWIAA